MQKKVFNISKKLSKLDLMNKISYSKLDFILIMNVENL